MKNGKLSHNGCSVNSVSLARSLLHGVDAMARRKLGLVPFVVYGIQRLDNGSITCVDIDGKYLSILLASLSKSERSKVRFVKCSAKITEEITR